MPVDYYAGLWLCGVFITGMILMVILEAVWDDVRRWWRNRKRKKCGWLRRFLARWTSIGWGR